jgi:AcrR family transcriptional regulator
VPEKTERAGRPRVNLREAQKQMTRDRLVDAAAESFRTRGYAATTIDDVVTGAGATRPTFYLHFKTKADLIGELGRAARKEVGDLNVRLRAAAASGERQAIRAYLDAAFDFWERVREFARAEEEAATLDTEIREARTRSFDAAVANIVAGLADAGRFDEAGRRVRAVLAYSQLQNVFHRWMRVGWDIDRGETLEVMTDMWSQALAG